MPRVQERGQSAPPPFWPATARGAFRQAARTAVEALAVIGFVAVLLGWAAILGAGP